MTTGEIPGVNPSLFQRYFAIEMQSLSTGLLKDERTLEVTALTEARL